MKPINQDPITNIVIIEGVDESLMAKVFDGSPIPLSVTKDLKHADRITAEMDNPLVFVELDDDSRQIQEHLVKAINLPLFQLIILIPKGANVSEKEQLKRVYKDLKFIEFDRTTAKGSEELPALIRRSFSEIYPFQNELLGIINKIDHPLLMTMPPSKQSKETALSIETIEHNTGIGGRTFSAYATNRKRAHLNGDIYIQVKAPESFLTKDYLPERPTYRSTIEKLEQECTDWERSHFHRTAFASYNILQSLQIEHSLIDVARATSLLYFFPTGVKSEQLTRSTYIRGSQSTVKKSMIKSLRANAASFNEQSELRDIAPVIDKIANVIDSERPMSMPSSSTEKNLCKIASTIILADLIDRECWQDSFWDSTGSYSIVRWIESDAGKHLDSDVVWEAMRFLVETLEATPPEHVVTKEKRKELLQSPPAKRNHADSHKNLKISQLTPGMRLANPLLTFDGKPVLDNDIHLDHDLVWRIWRLCSLYPLEPVQVVEQHP